MTDSDIIARQARQIMELLDQLAVYEECQRKAKLHIICVGGPLNDNKLKFTGAQLTVFQHILNELE